MKRLRIAILILMALARQAPAQGAGKQIEEAAVAKYGDAAREALGKCGPRAIELAEDLGGHGAAAVRLMAAHGKPALELVLEPPKACGLFIRFGDDAAGAIIRHGPDVAVPLLEAFGGGATGALKVLTPRNGRRLALMHLGGELTAIGRTEELLGVIAKFGDRAMELVWEKDWALADEMELMSFLVDPWPYVEGGRELGSAATFRLSEPRPAWVDSPAGRALGLGTRWLLASIRWAIREGTPALFGAANFMAWAAGVVAISLAFLHCIGVMPLIIRRKPALR